LGMRRVEIWAQPQRTVAQRRAAASLRRVLGMLVARRPLTRAGCAGKTET
jgi:hypothetical protein